MKLYIFAVGNKMPDWINSAFSEYAKRLCQEIKVHLFEIKPEKRTSGKHKEQVLQAEWQRIEAAIPAGCRIIALDEHGEQWTTVQLANTIKRWMFEGSDYAFVIGGADGLHDEIKSNAQHSLALSKLTFPHGLVRVMLIEQLYRAVSLIKNHPYHRI
ncbi:23S rRNA (pseudouridine(1915)-N(3))-methyltransferase RlmH [Nitrosomonas marina]|uniref:Ribosomal RNA large subunit methyltransferase H n=1 Tax=Nitrosomonas marina TaxID=917 RepID=A0A1H8CDR0_9PROT|nr:23S rRNA (pseudouridine(1915)-N(3))-methyltransferase RlmH [Nitrosomonas marina]SEM93175.1 23S rRNA (pseudouridine1915-N3)-methyltransferase [Nitrosomonas marina]